MNKRIEKVEVELEVLKAVARYYEFPLAVFFTPLSKWRKGHTRLNDLRNVAEKYKRIRAIVEEDDE